ncbi:MAG TPA: hypothetical protein VF260_11160 [Bacilli bacterium]
MKRLTSWSFKNKAAMLIVIIMSLIAGGLSYVFLLLTLIIVPCIYELFHFRKVKRELAEVH